MYLNIYKKSEKNHQGGPFIYALPCIIGMSFDVKYATNIPRSFEDGEQNGFLNKPHRELQPLKLGPKPQQLSWRLFGGRTWCRNTMDDKLLDTCKKFEKKNFSIPLS